MIHITNEELHILESMSDAEIGEKMGLVKFIRRLSADLLESRELIKEMRELISDIKEYGLSISRSDRTVAILERTKEYV